MAKKQQTYKRRNKVVGLADAVNVTIEPVFRKRGFASRDIITNWAAIAPTPYDKVSVPDKLHWPRGEAGAEGAILFLRCAEAHRLALSHEGELVSAAVNRYFGYILVGSVKLSAAPFTSGSAMKNDHVDKPLPETQRAVDAAISQVEDPGIKEALRQWGFGILKQKQ